MEHFKRGDEIEINSEDEGFRGSWYAGEVIKKLKKDKVLVEYTTIMENEAGQRRLREVLDVIQLRPPPPRETHRVELKLGDDVDAYHHDGWWEGVITEVLNDGKYWVYFRPTREQQKFRGEDLRLHREWVHYQRWDPPLQTEEAAAKDKEVSAPEELKPAKERLQGSFRQGTLVEVKTDEEGFEGAWLPATVIKKLHKDKYLIQYQSLRNSGNTEFLKEEADVSDIRPQPPRSAAVECFEVLQKVDALFNDCWWVGVVSKVLEDKKYVIYFYGTRDEMEFKHCDLRQHQDWIDGQWVIPSQAQAI